MTKPKYQYERIDLATDAIRLVRVLRDDHDGPVRCELFQSYLDRGVGVPYEALSYTWGDPNVPKVPIDIINEFTGRASTLLVLPNLHDILRYLRLPNKDRVLWIDAICIDQDQHTASLKERTHQVGQMRLVYKNADRVVAWLGNFSDASLMVQEPQAIATLMDFATELDHLAMSLATRQSGTHAWEVQLDTLVYSRQINERQGLDGFSAQQMSLAMHQLLIRPWFRRIWIVQEIASAQSGIVVCRADGRTVQTPMRTFALLPSLLKLEFVPPQTQAILDVMPLAGSQRKGWWNERRDLMALMRKFKDSQSTDPLDGIYALLGISSDAKVQDIIRPVYDIPLAVLLRKTLSYFLFQKLLILPFTTSLGTKLFGSMLSKTNLPLISEFYVGLYSLAGERLLHVCSNLPILDRPQRYRNP